MNEIFHGRRNVSDIRGGGGGANLMRRHHGWRRARKVFNFRSSRLPETAISRVFVKKKYSTSEKIFD